MAIKQTITIICDGCGDLREYPGASTLDALRHVQASGWWRGLLKREGNQYKEPTILCPACCERQGSDPALIRSP
jgi:hypothetical protein